MKYSNGLLCKLPNLLLHYSLFLNVYPSMLLMILNMYICVCVYVLLVFNLMLYMHRNVHLNVPSQVIFFGCCIFVHIHNFLNILVFYAV